MKCIIFEQLKKQNKSKDREYRSSLEYALSHHNKLNLVHLIITQSGISSNVCELDVAVQVYYDTWLGGVEDHNMFKANPGYNTRLARATQGDCFRNKTKQTQENKTLYIKILDTPTCDKKLLMSFEWVIWGIQEHISITIKFIKI